MGFGVRSVYLFPALAQGCGWSSDKSKVCGSWLAAEGSCSAGRRDPVAGSAPGPECQSISALCGCQGSALPGTRQRDYFYHT